MKIFSNLSKRPEQDKHDRLRLDLIHIERVSCYCYEINLSQVPIHKKKLMNKLCKIQKFNFLENGSTDLDSLNICYRG